MKVFAAEPTDFTHDGDWLIPTAARQFHNGSYDLVYDIEHDQYYEAEHVDPIMPVRIDENGNEYTTAKDLVVIGESYDNLKEYQRNKLLKLITNTQE